MPPSAEALRGRALGDGWYVELSEGRAYVDARLCARFDMPIERPNRHDYTSSHGVFVVSWTEREGACRIACTPRAPPLS